MSLPKVTIQLVTHQSLKYLPFTLESIFSQTYKDWQVLIIDNNSQDGLLDYLRKNYPGVTVFQNKKNLGFAKANNQGLRLLHSPYVLFCNPDIVLTNNWLEKIMLRAEDKSYDQVGSFGGKLLKLKPNSEDLDEESKTNIIDSCGLQILRNRRIVEIGAGEDSQKFNQSREVFGHSGALVLYKRATLEDGLIRTKKNPDGEYFDEDFFAYKEDIDLAWRSRLLGWSSNLVAEAVAYHVRRSAGSEKTTFGEIIKNRKQQSSLVRYYSYRNHLFLLLKNESLRNFFRDYWRIKLLEIKKAGYMFIFEFKNLKAWLELLKMAPLMMAKRKEIFKKAKISPLDISKWIVK